MRTGPSEPEIKAVASAGFASLGFAVLVAWYSPATAYESSIYVSTPAPVWFGLLAALAIFVGIVVRCAYLLVWPASRAWVFGLVGLGLCNALVLSLAIIRGYAFWAARADPGSHVGAIGGIVTTGHFQPDSLYPLIHVQVGMMSLLAGLGVADVGMRMPLLFAVIGFVFLFLWVRASSPSWSAVILAAALGTVLAGPYWVNLTPNHAGNLLFPMFLYVSARTLRTDGQKRLLGVLLLFMLSLPLLHPVPAFAFALILATLGLPFWVLRHVNGRESQIQLSLRTDLAIASLFAVWVVTRVSGFRAWSVVLRSLLQMAGGALDASLEQATYAAQLGYDVVTFLFRNYSDLLFFGMMALVALPLVLRALKTRHDAGLLFSLYGPFAFFCILYLLTYFSRMYGMQRTPTYIMLLATPLAGFALAELGTVTRLPRHLLVCVVSLGLMLLSVLGIMKLYPSPYVHSFNLHTTWADVAGFRWYFENRTDLDVAGMKVAPGRMADFLMYSEQSTEGAPRQEMYIPEHLQDTVHSAYEGQPTLGCGHEDDAYLIFNRMDRILYTDIYPELADLRMHPSKFSLLETDPSLGQVYLSTGFEVWYVSAGECGP